MAKQFRLTLINPSEAGVETFDYDDEVATWTSTDATKIVVERYTGYSGYTSAMRVYALSIKWGDTNPLTGDVYKFGDVDALARVIKWGYAGSDLQGEGIYKDFTVVPGEKVNLSWSGINLVQNIGGVSIRVYDHTNSDTLVYSTKAVLGMNETVKTQTEVTVPSTCTTLRVKFVAEGATGYVPYCNFLINSFALSTNALAFGSKPVAPITYIITPVEVGGWHQTLGKKRIFDRRVIQRHFYLEYPYVNPDMYDRLKALYDSSETLYFDDSEVDDYTETHTIYDNDTFTFSGISYGSTTHKAWYDSGSALPSAVDDYETTEFSTANYQAIDGDDSNYAETTDPADGYYLYHKFRLVSDITGSSVRRLRVKVSASSDDSSPGDYDGCVLYGWDGTSWDELDRTTNDSKNDLTFSTSEATIAQQYVDASGYVYLLLRSRGARDGTNSLDLKTYYAEVEINDGLSLSIELALLPRAIDGAPAGGLTVKNKTTGQTLTQYTDWTYTQATNTLTISGQSSGDVISVTYPRFWEVRISNAPERWLVTDPSNERNKRIHLSLETLTGD